MTGGESERGGVGGRTRCPPLVCPDTLEVPTEVSAFVEFSHTHIWTEDLGQ